MKLLSQLQKSFDFWFLLATSVLFFLMRLPSFFEPYWYGDEGVYEVLGYGIRHGRMLYQGIWDNKPPLLYLIYALFDGNQPYVRIFSFLVGLTAVYVFFLLSKSLFEEKKPAYIATGFFALFLGLPFLEGNIANAENFMILPIVAAVYLFIKEIKNKKESTIAVFSAGLFLGIAFLIKVVSVFDFATLCFVLLTISFAWKKEKIIRLIIQLIVMGAGFFLPLIATVGFFASKGMLRTFIQSAFLSNVSYVGYGNQLIIPQGFLLLKLLILAIILTIIFIKRKSLSLALLLLYTWLPFSLFNIFFSQRPYTHYLLGLLASLSLLVGVLTIKQLRIFHSLVFAVTVLLLATNFWFYGNTISYYGNFIQMLTGQKTMTQYQAFFDKGVPRDYAIADFLRTTAKPQDAIFLWTNSAQIYYLIGRLPLGRYTVAYHMTFTPTAMQETAMALQKYNPRFVVILPNAPAFPFKMVDYRLVLTIQDGLIYEKVF